MKQKILAFSILRPAAMLMIVLYHCILTQTDVWHDSSLWTRGYQHIATFLVEFSLPTFFFISGFLFRISYLHSSIFYSFILKKVRRLLIPYLLWSILVIVLQYGEYGLLDVFTGNMRHLWYLHNLMVMMLLICFAPLILNLKNIYLDFLIALGIEVLFYLILKHVNWTLSFGWGIIKYTVFFYIGTVIGKYDVFKRLNPKMFLIFTPPILWEMHRFVKLDIWLGDRLIDIIFVTATIVMLLSYLHKREGVHPLIEKLDYRCMGIYIIHNFLLIIILKCPLLVKVLTIKSVSILVALLVFVLTSSYLLTSSILKSKKFRFLLGC